MTVIEQSRYSEHRIENREQKPNTMLVRSSDISDRPQKVAVSISQSTLDKLMASLPPWYKKIHARFPHLSDEKCVDLMEYIRTIPGHTIAVHSGIFTAIDRPTGGTQRRPDVSWSCCHAISQTGKITYCEFGACIKNGVLVASYYIGQPPCPESSDRMKSSPCGKCDNPTLFSLDACDFP